VQRNAMEDFQRDITCRTLKREDGQVSLTALLRDRFHDIRVEVVAEPETLTITAAGVDFRRSPTPDCGNIRNLLLGLLPLALNVRVSAGFTDEREMLDTIHEKLRGTCAGYASEPGHDTCMAEGLRTPKSREL